MLVLHKESHLDHGLSQEAIEFILKKFSDKEEFFIEQVELPEELGKLDNALYGPTCGDKPVEEDEVFYTKRGDREWDSRMTTKPVRKTSLCTVIGGPHEEHACILYTAYGGPQAMQEPGDPGCKDVEASKAFWAEHALSR